MQNRVFVYNLETPGRLPRFAIGQHKIWAAEHKCTIVQNLLVALKFKWVGHGSVDTIDYRIEVWLR